jgi:hypothetical protein
MDKQALFVIYFFFLLFHTDAWTLQVRLEAQEA